jgi:hypothetical protein
VTTQFPVVPLKKKPVYESLVPRISATIDGKQYLPKSYVLTTNAHGATDTATVEIPISTNPDWTQQIARSDSGGNANKPVPIEIFLDLNNTGIFMSRFVGIVDQYSAAGAADGCTFSCRSMAAPLTSTKITTPFTAGSSITTVAFIQQQAARFGLTTNIVLAPGQQPAQMIKVLGAEFVTGVRNWNIWDLMLQCAQYDDVDIWVDRTGQLNYQATSFITRNPLQYVWGENILDLVGTHSPQFSRNVQVEVHSYTKRTRQSSGSRAQSLINGGMQTTNWSRKVIGSPIFGTTDYVSTSYNSDGTVTTTKSSLSGGSASSGPTKFATESGVERYIFYVANKTPADCDLISKRIWRQISMHEYSIKLTVPIMQSALGVMDVTADIEVYGFPLSAFNQNPSTGKSSIAGVPDSQVGGGYWPREIVETVDINRGAIWEVDAVNHSLAAGAV